MPTIWADTSHYQLDDNDAMVFIDDSYPYRVYSFRTNSGDVQDRAAIETCERVLSMLERGKLDAVFPYYFFKPGEANCDLHKETLEAGGLWQHPRMATMVDVEDAGGAIVSDQSDEVNDEVARLVGWYGLDQRRVFGYLNAVSNAHLWQRRPYGMRFVTPNYSRVPGQWLANSPPPKWMQGLAFAQQYTDVGVCPPWPKGVDLNYSPMDLPVFLASFGFSGGFMTNPVEVAAGQLHPFANRIRPMNKPENVNGSTQTPEAPWPYDMQADIWNEVVWDGYTIDHALADLDDDVPRSVVSLIRTIAARQVAVNQKMDEILAVVRGNSK